MATAANWKTYSSLKRLECESETGFFFTLRYRFVPPRPSSSSGKEMNLTKGTLHPTELAISFART